MKEISDEYSYLKYDLALITSILFVDDNWRAESNESINLVILATRLAAATHRSRHHRQGHLYLRGICSVNNAVRAISRWPRAAPHYSRSPVANKHLHLEQTRSNTPIQPNECSPRMCLARKLFCAFIVKGKNPSKIPSPFGVTLEEVPTCSAWEGVPQDALHILTWITLHNFF